MAGYRVSTEVLFMGSDLSRSRWPVEREKLKSQFPEFKFYALDGQVSSVRGNLTTNYGNTYFVSIKIPEGYPYVLPDIELPYHSIASGCPHIYTGDRICVMRSVQWSSSLSLAFLVAKAAIWLNKYDLWENKGKRRWPGKGQSH